MSFWCVYYKDNDILHFNPNHDPRTGQFSSGGTRLKGINRMKYMNEDGSLTEKGQKKYGAYRSKADADIVNAKKQGYPEMVNRKRFYIYPIPYGLAYGFKRWTEPVLASSLRKARRYRDKEYVDKILKTLYDETKDIPLSEFVKSVGVKYPADVREKEGL